MRLVAAAAERWTHIVVAVLLLGEHMLKAEASKRDLGGSSSWGYMCCHMECLLLDMRLRKLSINTLFTPFELQINKLGEEKREKK